MRFQLDPSLRLVLGIPSLRLVLRLPWLPWLPFDLSTPSVPWHRLHPYRLYSLRFRLDLSVPLPPWVRSFLSDLSDHPVQEARSRELERSTEAQRLECRSSAWFSW